MNKSSFYGLLILVLLFFSAGISYACNLPPQANIQDCPKYTAVDSDTYFNGFSTDPDGYIVEWRWYFPPQAYDVNYHPGEPWKVTCKFDPPGVYSVILEVEDNLGATDTFNCTVYALKVTITGDGAYIPVNTDDDNENSIQDRHEFDEPIDDEDDLYEITLTLEPDNLPDGRMKLEIGASYEGTLSVWGEPNKAASLINPYHPTDPTTEHEWNVSGPFSKTVWVEGYNVHNTKPFGSLGLYFLHPTQGHPVDTDGARFNPVQVRLEMDGVIEDNEEFPGNYILYNKDDDDNDGVIDYDDLDNPAEDDLVKIMPVWTEPAHCQYGPECSITGTVTFNVSPPDAKVKVWIAHPDYPTVNILKYAQLSFTPDPPVYETPDDLPRFFYVEGFEPSDGPRDVVFTLTHNGLGFQDTVKVTVIHVELFIDAGYTKPLDDWPKDGDLLRSPKYMFGETDPIYVQVKNIGTDPDVAETIYDAVSVNSESSLTSPPEPAYVYLTLKETGVDTQIFRNSEAAGELLYLFTSSSEGNGDKIKIIDEEVLDFYLSIPPGNTSYYKRSEDVMVDRAEVIVEWQSDYDTYDTYPTIGCADDFAEGFYDNLGTTNLVWFKNDNNGDLDSKEANWDYQYDSGYVDAADIALWCGHGPVDAAGPYMRFFVDTIGGLKQSADKLYWSEIDWGDIDADWVVLNTCSFLNGTDTELKQMISSSRGVHLICGYKTDMTVY
ncbi:MAG: DUF6345 domain-containing protein, partial [Planctomycetota bacterium]